MSTSPPPRPPVRAALRDAGVAALLVWVVLLTGFVRHRNHEHAARERARATAAAEAVARGEEPVHAVSAAGVVRPAVRPDPTRPYLARRTLVTIGGERVLGGPAANAADKLLYDAAARFDRDGRRTYVAVLRDGSGRAVAVVPTAHGPAIAVTAPPGPPAGLPWLMVIGVVGLGAVLAAAGALSGRGALGVGAGLSVLVVPGWMWGGGALAGFTLVAAAAVAWAHARGATDRFAAGIAAHRVALSFLAPAAIAMLVLVLVPFAVGLVIGFYDHSHGEWSFVGVDNFGRILSGDGRAFDDPLNFWFILGVTVLWTGANVVFHVMIGTTLALALRQPWLRARGLFRVLLIVPWAIPNYITALIWKGMFQGEYGAVNSLLEGVGLDGVSWFSSWATAFAANVATNTWLGFPFMMVVALGALESIPRDLYEAAEVDGASAWQRLTQITLPHLRPALAPAVILGSIWTFNMFNVIFLVSGGKPGGSTDILVTDAYRWAFERGERYGMAAAMGTIIFLILLLWTVFGTRVTRKEEAP
jgi:ABC-type sugar transport system permease subunit